MYASTKADIIAAMDSPWAVIHTLGSIYLAIALAFGFLSVHPSVAEFGVNQWQMVTVVCVLALAGICHEYGSTLLIYPVLTIIIANSFTLAVVEVVTFAVFVSAGLAMYQKRKEANFGRCRQAS